MIAELFFSAYLAQPRRVAYQLPADIEAKVVKSAPKGAGIYSKIWCIASPWEASREYTAGTAVTYQDRCFFCIQAHKAGPDWTPDRTPALWREVFRAEPGYMYPAWHQPTGQHDSYKMGDRVVHKGQVWQSDFQNNVWEPGVFGWSPVKTKKGTTTK